MSDFEITPECYSEKWDTFVFGHLKLAEAAGDAPNGVADQYWDRCQQNRQKENQEEELEF